MKRWIIIISAIFVTSCASFAVQEDDGSARSIEQEISTMKSGDYGTDPSVRRGNVLGSPQWPLDRHCGLMNCP